MLIDRNAYAAIAIVPIAMVIVHDANFAGITIPKSLSLAAIFVTASLICQLIYSNQMSKLWRTEIELRRKFKETVKQKGKRRSLIQLVDNRKSFDLTKWKNKNYPLVNNRYSSYTENSNAKSKYKKRVKSWHGEVSVLKNQKNVLAMDSSPLLSQSEFFNDSQQDSSDYRSSLFSTNSTIFENDDTRITNDSDSNIIDMSVDIGTDYENQKCQKPPAFKEKTGFIATYLYDRFRNNESGMKYISSKEAAVLTPSYLKPFNLKRSEHS